MDLTAPLRINVMSSKIPVPAAFIKELFRLQEKYGPDVYHVSQRPKGGTYIGKGSPLANPWRGSFTVKQRILNIYKFAKHAQTLRRTTFSRKQLSYLKYEIVVCYCHYGLFDYNPRTLCHGMVIKAIANNDFNWSTLEENNDYEY